MTNEERAELDELRAKVARMEQTENDRRNPNVMLIEGRLASYEGEWSAWSVNTGSGLVYLADIVRELVGWRNVATFQWHMATEPLSFYELEENLVKTVMGEVNAEFNHAYSDLTGYLWTTESIEVKGHDILEEIAKTYDALHGDSWQNKVYIAFRVERSPD